MVDKDEVADVVQQYLAGKLSAQEAADQISSIVGSPTSAKQDQKVHELLDAVQPMTIWPCAIIVVTVTKCN